MKSHLDFTAADHDMTEWKRLNFVEEQRLREDRGEPFLCVWVRDCKLEECGFRQNATIDPHDPHHPERGRGVIE